MSTVPPSAWKRRTDRRSQVNRTEDATPPALTPTTKIPYSPGERTRVKAKVLSKPKKAVTTLASIYWDAFLNSIALQSARTAPQWDLAQRSGHFRRQPRQAMGCGECDGQSRSDPVAHKFQAQSDGQCHVPD